MRIAVVQMASGSNREANLVEAGRLIEQAADDGANVVVLPENFGMVGARPEDVLEVVENPGRGTMQDFLADQAASQGILLFGGSIPLASSDPARYFNSLLVYGPDGSCQGRYDKIHLFDVTIPDGGDSYHESELIEAGQDSMVVEFESTKIGLSICYDLRFPELYRGLVKQGAEVIVVPAAFTAETGQAHWHTLLKARAIENLAFVVASAQGGYHVNGRATYGHSMIVDPWGNTLDELASGNGYAIADIDLSRQQQIRQRFPVLDHRKIF